MADVGTSGAILADGMCLWHSAATCTEAFATLRAISRSLIGFFAAFCLVVGMGWA